MIRLRQIEVPIENEDSLKKKCASKLKINEEKIKKIIINKKSIDARDKSNILYCYEVDIEVENEKIILKKNKSKDILKTPNENYQFKITGTNKMKSRPIIVGAGPSGLFCGYILSKYGYRPLIIERGEKIEKRVEIVEKFWETGKLNNASNVQFGEGGAGTFSDGKLNTQVKDKEFRNKQILKIFVECGAPKDILYLNKPHIGTDKLREVVINLRNKIIKMGSEIRYNTCLTNLIINDEKINAIEVNNTEIIETDALIVCIGHSARDTFKMLKNNKVQMEPKSFAVGLRIQHSQENINFSQYGEFASKLPPAIYKLTYRASNERGVYTFCMCPGGFVVNASSEEGHLVVNGMSNYLRETKNANSAVVVTVTPDDFNNSLFGGMEFQEKLERKAFEIADGKIPVQLLEDFMNNKMSTKIKDVTPIMKGSYEFANLQEILPEFITQSIKEAIPQFDKKIKGFANKDAILAGVETRTSSPIRILRDEEGQNVIRGIYPTGEGAGYAGGIMSAAMDGLKTAENIARIYKP